jgi:hypothetical protein
MYDVFFNSKFVPSFPYGNIIISYTSKINKHIAFKYLKNSVLELFGDWFVFVITIYLIFLIYVFEH